MYKNRRNVKNKIEVLCWDYGENYEAKRKQSNFLGNMISHVFHLHTSHLHLHLHVWSCMRFRCMLGWVWACEGCAEWLSYCIWHFVCVAIEVCHWISCHSEFKLNSMQQDNICREFKICERKSTKIKTQVLGGAILWKPAVGKKFVRQFYIDAMNVPHTVSTVSVSITANFLVLWEVSFTCHLNSGIHHHTTC